MSARVEGDSKTSFRALSITSKTDRYFACLLIFACLFISMVVSSQAHVKVRPSPVVPGNWSHRITKNGKFFLLFPLHAYVCMLRVCVCGCACVRARVSVCVCICVCVCVPCPWPRQKNVCELKKLLRYANFRCKPLSLSLFLFLLLCRQYRPRKTSATATQSTPMKLARPH